MSAESLSKNLNELAARWQDAEQPPVEKGKKVVPMLRVNVKQSTIELASKTVSTSAWLKRDQVDATKGKSISNLKEIIHFCNKKRVAVPSFLLDEIKNYNASRFFSISKTDENIARALSIIADSKGDEASKARAVENLKHLYAKPGELKGVPDDLKKKLVDFALTASKETDNASDVRKLIETASTIEKTYKEIRTPKQITDTTLTVALEALQTRTKKEVEAFSTHTVSAQQEKPTEPLVTAMPFASQGVQNVQAQITSQLVKGLASQASLTAAESDKPEQTDVASDVSETEQQGAPPPPAPDMDQSGIPLAPDMENVPSGQVPTAPPPTFTKQPTMKEMLEYAKKQSKKPPTGVPGDQSRQVEGDTGAGPKIVVKKEAQDIAKLAAARAQRRVQAEEPVQQPKPQAAKNPEQVALAVVNSTDIEQVKKLMEQNEELTGVSEQLKGKLLVLACQQENEPDLAIAILRLCKTKDALEQKDSEKKMTPLHWAAAQGHKRVVKAIFNNSGFEKILLTRTANQKRPIDVAEDAGRTEIVDLIKKSFPEPQKIGKPPVTQTASAPPKKGQVPRPQHQASRPPPRPTPTPSAHIASETEAPAKSPPKPPPRLALDDIKAKVEDGSFAKLLSDAKGRWLAEAFSKPETLDLARAIIPHCDQEALATAIKSSSIENRDALHQLISQLRPRKA